MTASIAWGFSRRGVIGSAAAGVALAATSARAQAKAKYTRYNVMSAKGQEMLAAYKTAVAALMALPPTDPRNWFRNSFVHCMDCPHGNWWFFVWHRGFLGFFEQTLREFSGRPQDFAIPYWDWTTLPQIPAGMFDGVLDPSNPPYAPFIKDFATYKAYLNPAMTAYWKTLTPSQLNQLKIRGMPTLDTVWSQVAGNLGNNSMFAPTANARYLTATGTPGPNLDPGTQKTVSLQTIMSSLGPVAFDHFNSGQTPSHNAQPGGVPFAILEGQPHNNVHNCIGGVPFNPPPSIYGYMADNLSLTDPVFFLHHSNMDRLWDVWTRKQQKCGLPILPTGAKLTKFNREPFEFYFNSKGQGVTNGKAGDYVNTSTFDYDYEPGSGEQILSRPCPATIAVAAAQFKGQVQAGLASVAVPTGVLAQHSAGQLPQPLVVEVTLPHPAGAGAARSFDIFVGAPAGAKGLTVDSPNYAGTVAFFGTMAGMHGDQTFVVPLPPNLPASNGPLTVQAIPRGGSAGKTAALLAAAPPASVLKAATVTAW